MQHSLKFVLSDSSSYARVSSAFPQSTYPLVLMEDSFLDTDDRLLSRNNIMLRVRRYVNAGSSKHHEKTPPTAEVRAMQHSTVTDGCAQRWDTHASLDPNVAEKIFLLKPTSNKNQLEDPIVMGELLDKLLASCGNFLRKIISTATGVPSPPLLKFVKLGGYRTLRDTRPWNNCTSQTDGLKLRIDHTTYSFGERFEVEVPDITVPVQDVVDELGAALQKAGSKFTLGHETKWQVMMAAKNSADVKEKMAVAAKIELASLSDFQIVRRSLGGLPAESQHDEPAGELQDNYFFDDMHYTLRKRNIVFRLRILPKTGKAFVTIKENEPVNSGSAVSWMQQEEIPREVVESTLQNPSNFFLHPSSAAEKLQSLLAGSTTTQQLTAAANAAAAAASAASGSSNSNTSNNNSQPGSQQNQNSMTPQRRSVSQNSAAAASNSTTQASAATNLLQNLRSPPKPGTSARASEYPHLIFVGSYKNRREIFVWPSCSSQPGLSLHLDKTKYNFGERYEVEVPGITVPVHDVVSELSDVLTSLEVRFRACAQDKMQTMLAGGDVGTSGNGDDDEDEERALF